MKRFAGSPTTTDSLLSGIRATDEDSWRRLVDIYSPLILDWLVKNGVRGANASDVAQEVFAAVFLGLSGFDHLGSGSFRGWLWGITRHKICDHFRGLPHVSIDTQILEEGSVAQSAVGQDTVPPPDALEPLYDALEAVRGLCEERTWNAFYALVLEERPAADVARDLEMSLGAVYVAKSRVLRRLREALGVP